MNLMDSISSFFKGLNTKETKPTDELPPVYVVRSNDVKPNTTSSLGKLQPKIEQNLVKVGELPLMSKEQYDKVYAEDNLKDKTSDSDYVAAYASKYGIKDTGLAKTIYDVAKKFDESPELLYKIANHESAGFNPKALNAKTKAAGLFQFLPSTWKDVKTRLSGGEHTLDDPFNPEQNTTAAALYLQDIKKQLSKVKDESKITDQDVYLGHFSGARRAAQVINALEKGRGSLTADKIYSPTEIQSNPSVFYVNKAEKGKPFKAGRMKTLKEVYDTITTNVNKKDTKDISFYLPKTTTEV